MSWLRSWSLPSPGPKLLAEVAGTSGNPLYIGELLAALREELAVGRGRTG